MATTVETDTTHDQFKSIMRLMKDEADATLALIAAGHTPAASALTPEVVDVESLADESAKLMPDHAQDALAQKAKPLPADIKAAFTSHKAGGTRILNGAQATTKAATTQRVAQIKQGTGSNKDFRARLGAIRDKNIKDFKKEQDRVFDQLVNLGEKHPEQQNNIVSLFQGVSRLFANLWSKVGSFLVDLGIKILSIVGTAVKKVVNFFTGAAKTVGNIFSSIF